jgi:hypothetical protein
MLTDSKYKHLLLCWEIFAIPMTSFSYTFRQMTKVKELSYIAIIMQ